MESGHIESSRSTSTGLDLERLWADGAYRRSVAVERREELVDVLAQSYPLVSREYVARYLDHMLAERHIENPLAARYLETELGAVGKYLDFVRRLARQGYEVSGRKCLDIGCSNGALALACLRAGASDALGVDVSAGRLETARRLCEGSDVRLRQADIVGESIGEEFDVIFCMDVLEHVRDARAAIAEISRCLRRDESSFAYVTVFNRNGLSNVLEEPHYSVSGLIRLDPQDAQRVWESVRRHRESRLDYDVHDWHDCEDYMAMASEFGLRAEPCYSEETMLRSRAGSMRDYERVASDFEREFSQRVSELSISEDDRHLIQTRVASYLEAFRRDHASISPSDPESVKRLFLKYYAQPIAMMLRPVEFEHAAPVFEEGGSLPESTGRVREWVKARPRLARPARRMLSLLRGLRTR